MTGIWKIVVINARYKALRYKHTVLYLKDVVNSDKTQDADKAASHNTWKRLFIMTIVVMF